MRLCFLEVEMRYLKVVLNIIVWKVEPRIVVEIVPFIVEMQTWLC